MSRRDEVSRGEASSIKGGYRCRDGESWRDKVSRREGMNRGDVGAEYYGRNGEGRRNGVSRREGMSRRGGKS